MSEYDDDLGTDLSDTCPQCGHDHPEGWRCGHESPGATPCGCSW